MKQNISNYVMILKVAENCYSFQYDATKNHKMDYNQLIDTIIVLLINVFSSYLSHILRNCIIFPIVNKSQKSGMICFILRKRKKRKSIFSCYDSWYNKNNKITIWKPLAWWIGFNYSSFFHHPDHSFNVLMWTRSYLSLILEASHRRCHPSRKTSNCVI